MATPLPVTLDQLKLELNMSPAGTDKDGELTLRLAAATRAVEGRIGPIVSRSFTERVLASTRFIVVPKTPLVSVESLTSVVGDSQSWTPEDLDVDSAGVIQPLRGFFRGRYDVTFTAGRADSGDDVAEHIQMAVLIVASHLWETQRGRSARSRSLGEYDEASSRQDVALLMSGFALPRRALELLQPEYTSGMA